MKIFFLFFLLFNPIFCSAIEDEIINPDLERLFILVKNFRDQSDEKKMLDYGNKAIKFADSIKDLIAKAKVYIVIGNYYYDKNESSVIAYSYFYKALRTYTKAHDKEKMAKTLLRLAILEKNTRNFLKSKESCFLALELLENCNSDFEDHIYNNLGIVYGELKDIRNSQLYHKKALDLRLQNKQEEMVLQSYNNIATAYMENGYLDKAVLFYKKGLSTSDSVLELYPEEYARLLDNYAHLQFIQGQKDILQNMLKALAIREDCGHNAGILSSYLNLANYYNQLEQFTISNSFALKTYNKALLTKNFRDALIALELLVSNFKQLGDFKNALKYSEKHKSIVDFLANEELNINEKFADIRYAATQKEKEIKVLKLRSKVQQLQSEKRKNFLYLTIGIFSLISLLGLGYVLFSKLKHKQKEQLATQEIIQLIFEKQQAVENAKNIEQKRIANDLHDSIAGKLSGLMLKLDSIGTSSSTEIKRKIDPTVNYLEEILEELQAIVHDMNEQQVITISYPILIKEIANQQFSGKLSISSNIDSSIDWISISNQVKLAIYYIILQSIRNIYEHSEASNATVLITQDQKNLIITINDNGIGLKKEISLGLGISSMKKRVKNLDGYFEIFSSYNQGTKISIKIPIQ